MSEGKVDESNKATDPQVAAIYRNIVDNIKVTDDISFKLLGSVPLLSGVGSGALSLLLKSGHKLEDYTVLPLSLVGCAITFGLYKWEMRNIQKCAWFISRAARIERKVFQYRDVRQFDGFDSGKNLEEENLKSIKIQSFWADPAPTTPDVTTPKPDSPCGKTQADGELHWGKTRAEKLIYGAAMAAWLIPAFVSIASLTHLINR